MSYQPHKASRQILERAWGYIQEVPYQVTARWLFYRLLQDGTYQKKSDYSNRFLPLLTRARKAFYAGWTPDVLADDTRRVAYRGFGGADAIDWLRNGIEGCELDKWQSQSYYLELWFEAAAMVAQFLHYTRHITLRPFQGDPSLDFKWGIAKHFEKMSEVYADKPIVVLYFGDLDEKGLQIPESAMADIRAWSHADFEFVRCGLNPGDEVRFDLPENIDKPGTYQWEALSDADARDMILGNVTRFVDFAAMAEIEDREQAITVRFRAEIDALAERWAA